MNGLVGAFAGLIDGAANETGRDESDSMRLSFLLGGDPGTADRLANADLTLDDVGQLSELGWLWYLNFRAGSGAPPPVAFLDALHDRFGDDFTRSEIVESAVKGSPAAGKPPGEWDSVDDIPTEWVRHRFLAGLDVVGVVSALLDHGDDVSVGAVRALLRDDRMRAHRDRVVMTVADFLSNADGDIRAGWLARLGLDVS